MLFRSFTSIYFCFFHIVLYCIILYCIFYSILSWLSFGVCLVFLYLPYLRVVVFDYLVPVMVEHSRNSAKETRFLFGTAAGAAGTVTIGVACVLCCFRRYWAGLMTIGVAGTLRCFRRYNRKMSWHTASNASGSE